MHMPDPLEGVLHDSRYWTVENCRLFLERCDDLAFDDPQSGQHLAEIAGELVTRVEEATGTPQPALRAHALSVRGTACRVAGDLAGARTHYEEARALYGDDPTVHGLDRADLYRRLVFLHGALREWDDAFNAANRAGKIFLAAGDPHGYGRVLLAKASVLGFKGEPEAAVPVLAEALAHLDFDRSPQAFYAAIHDLAVAIAESKKSSSALLDAAVDWLREARRAGRARGLGVGRFGYRKRTVPDAKLRYALGLLLRRRGWPKRAIVFLEGAREDLAALEMPLDVVDVALDLGALYAQVGRFAELQQLAQESIRLLAPYPQLRQLEQALHPWQTAILAGEATPVAVAELLRTGRAHLTRHSPRPALPEPLDHDALRRQLITSIRKATSGCRSLEELREWLRADAITLHYREPAKGRPPGIAFELHGRRFTGHQLGRNFRWSQILAQMETAAGR